MTLTYKHASYGEMQRSVILNQNVMSFSLCACPLPSKIVMKTTRNSLHPNESQSQNVRKYKVVTVLPGTLQ